MATVPTSSFSSSAEELAVVRSSLDRLARRVRLAIWMRYASFAVLAGSALSIIGALIWRTGRLDLPLIPLVFAIYATAVIVASIFAFRSKIPLLSVALLADDRQGLKQRLSSSLALSSDPDSISSPFFRLQMVDAAAVAPALDARKVLPLHVRWEAIAAAISLLLTILATALVLHAMGIGVVNGMGPSLVAQEGAKLADEAKKIGNNADAQRLPQTKQYADKLAKLARQMQSRKMSQSEAVKQLSNLSTQVRQQQNQLARQSTANANAGNKAPAASNGSKTAANQKQAAGDAASLSETLRKMADQISSSPLTPAEQKRMSQDLNDLAGQAQSAGLPQTAKHIGQASKALGQAKKAQAVSELRQAAKIADQEEKQALQQAAKQAQSQAGQQAQNKPGSTQNSQQANQPGQQSQGQKGQGQQASGQKAQGQKGQGQKGQGQQAQGQKGQGQQAQGQKGRYNQTAQAGKGQQQEQGSQPGQQSTPGQQPQNAGQAQQGQSSENGQQSQSGEKGGSQASANPQGAGSDAQGLQRIERSLQQAEQHLSGQSGSDSPNSNGSQNGTDGQGNSQKPGSGNGQSQKPGGGKQRLSQGGYNAQGQQGGGGQAKGGAPSNVTQGDSKGSPTSPGKYSPSTISGTGYKTPKSNMGVWRGQPQQIDNYNPSRNSRYARVYLPATSQSGKAITRNDSTPPGAGPRSGQVSSVPYYQVYPQFKKSAESALSKEDIPRAYAKKVRQYFQSLTPTAR